MAVKSSELAEKFDEYNALTIKRWIREFLPPDPAAGRQSGYTRQLTLDEAFTVYLGGHLVRTLKFKIQEARQIISDLEGFLLEKGLMPSTYKEELKRFQTFEVFEELANSGEFRKAEKIGTTKIGSIEIDLMPTRSDPQRLFYVVKVMLRDDETVDETVDIKINELGKVEITEAFKPFVIK